MHWIIVGQPGSGKSRLATALSLRLQEMGWSTQLLHCDLLKVTLRSLGIEGLSGLSTGTDFPLRQQIVQPYIQEQIDKASNDGYSLIVEGTLAVGMQSEKCRTVELNISEQLFHQRIELKHSSAALSLKTDHNFHHFQKILMNQRPMNAQQLDGGHSTMILVQKVLEDCAEIQLG
jgi:adenylate kinase family enzyme